MSKHDVNEDFIRTLAELLKDTGLTEIEYETDNQRLRLARAVVAPAVVATPPVTPPPVPTESPATPPQPASAPEDALTSPMVGTAYLAPEPGAANFIKVGDSVSEGQTLMILEAMKVMNPLPSPKSGVIKKILVQDNQPVEFGEPLIVFA